MATTRIEHRQAGPATTTWPNRDPVFVEVAEPHAVFWNGEQRTGTLHNVPLDLAVDWLRQGWASYFFADVPDKPATPHATKKPK